MSIEDDYIDHIARTGTGFVGGLEDEGLQRLDAVGLLSKSGLPLKGKLASVDRRELPLEKPRRTRKRKG